MKKITAKEILRKLDDEAKRLTQDEGAWLKSLGELGDMARILLKVQTDQTDQLAQIITLTERVEALERRLNNANKK